MEDENTTSENAPAPIILTPVMFNLITQQLLS